MNDPTKNQLKSQLMSEIKEYITKVWGGKDADGKLKSVINGVEIIEDKTFSESFPKAFYEKKEYGVDLENSLIPHTYGVLWSIEDLKVTIGDNLEDSGKMSLFSRTYSNNTDKVINVSEKLEEAIRVTDSTTIGFTEKINAGVETSVTAGVDIGVAKASATAKFSMNVELGASQSNTKTLEQTTTAGFQMQFEVAPYTKKVVTITATRKTGRTYNDAIFVANGKVYVKVAYNKEELNDETHVYIIDTAAIKASKEKEYGTEKEMIFPLKYPVKYVIENVTHTNYNVEIKEIPLNASAEKNRSTPLVFPLDVQTTDMCLVSGK